MRRLLLTALVFSSQFASSQEAGILYEQLFDDSSKVSPQMIEKYVGEYKSGIIFFCPNNYGTKDELYYNELKAIYCSQRMKEANPKIIGFSYKNEDAFVLNPRMNSVTVSELDCYLYNVDTLLLNRAISKHPFYFFEKSGLPNNIVRLCLSDEGKKVCPPDLASKIYFYQDVLFELYDPVYSTEEQLDQLRNEFATYRTKTDETIQKLQAELEKLKSSNTGKKK